MSGNPFQRYEADEPNLAAARWALRHSASGASNADEPEFAKWLGQDAENGAAYADALWALDAVDRSAGEAEILALRHAALAARGKPRSSWRLLGVGAIAAAAAGLLTWASLPRQADRPVFAAEQSAVRKASQAENFRTGIGQRAAIDLPDGSVVTLDTDSEIRVAYSQRSRAIYLLSGQALFEVAHGQAKPFQVFAKGQMITAVGTAFNVRIEGAGVRVSMVEGVVKMKAEGRIAAGRHSHAAEVTLTAGEVAFAAPDSIATVERPADIGNLTSWKGGMLVFEDTPLLSAVAEINRYTKRPIAIADPAVASYRVSGVFKTNDPDHFSQAMAEVLPIEITRASDGSVTLRARKD